MRIAALLLVLSSVAAADHEPAPFTKLDELRKALPAGWELAVDKRNARELTIRHTTPVRMAGQFWSAHTTNAYIPASDNAPTVTLQLRYRIEPRWTELQYDAARRINANVFRQLNLLRERERIDDIPLERGIPVPRDADEKARLARYRASYEATSRQLAQQPRCTLGDLSVFDGKGTYAQLDLVVDPPAAMREAFAIVELVKRRCR